MEKVTDTQKKRWIKYIQTGRRTLGLPDDVYISILYNAAGVDSAAKITTEKQFMAVKRSLNSAGFIQQNKHSAAYSFIETVNHRAKNVLGDAWAVRLAAYLQKTGLPEIKKCTDRQLRSVMGFLSRVEKIEGKK